MPLPPVTIGKRFEPRRLQQLAQIARGLAHLRKVDARIGIEVEDEPIRLLQRLGARAPQVDLDTADLRHGDEAGRAVDHEIVGDLAVAFLHRHRLQGGRHALLGVLLEEALLGRPLRAAHEAQRAPAAVRQHALADGEEIFGEVELGYVGLEEQHAIGMRDLHAGNFVGARY